MKHLNFYLRQGWSNMNRNRQRTIFVLFCIAVGVAAIVSLRTLGLMIGDSLTQNLQEDNKGDMVVTVPVLTLITGGDYDDDLVNTPATPFQTPTFSEEGIERMQAWANEQGYDITVAARQQGPGRARLDNGDESAPESILTYFVEPDAYPFYGEIEFIEPAEITLAEALAEPNSIVITEGLANLLGAGVGDHLRLAGPEGYLVTAIVDDGNEASLQDINAILLPYAYLSYETGVEQFAVLADAIYFQIPEGEDSAAAGEAFADEFLGIPTVTVEDLREQNSEISENLTRLITTMGLVSLLIGGIGIANTMIVVVGRRTLEIGVLKTIGLQGRQITIMFLLEALLMGIVGSILGIVLGLGLVFILQNIAEQVISQNLNFALYPEALSFGLVTGVLVTLVFGFLPTLSAGNVRPSVVLQPSETIIPKAGRLASILVVILLTGVMGILVGIVMGNILIGIGVAYGTVIILGLFTLVFWVLVIILSQLPSFGFINIKLAQRAMGSHAGRTASTLLALVVGMFSLSLIILLSQSVINVVNSVLADQMGGNLLVIPLTLEDSDVIEEELATMDGINSIEHDVLYTADIVAINGDRDIETLVDEAADRGVAEAQAQSDSDEPIQREITAGNQGTFDIYEFQVNDFVAPFDMQLARDSDWEYEVGEGRDITPQDEASVVVQESSATMWLQLEVGDTLTLGFSDGQEVDVTIAGIIPEPAFGGANVTVGTGAAANAIVSDSAIPEGFMPNPAPFVVDVEDEQVDEVAAAFADIPGVFVFEVSELQELLERILQQLTALPLIVAILALFASSIIIANTVSLATLERRRQIGIMKAIGMQSGNVLRLLLIENGLVGLLGGLIGTGIGTIGILTTGILTENFDSFPLLTLVILVILAVAISLGATMITAYGASREKPLIVLRYE